MAKSENARTSLPDVSNPVNPAPSQANKPARPANEKNEKGDSQAAPAANGLPQNASTEIRIDPEITALIRSRGGANRARLEQRMLARKGRRHLIPVWKEENTLLDDPVRVWSPSSAR